MLDWHWLYDGGCLVRKPRFGHSGFTFVAAVKQGEEAALRQKLIALRENSASPGLQLQNFEEVHFSAFLLICIEGEINLIYEGNIDGKIADFFRRLVANDINGLDYLLNHCEGYPGPDRETYLKNHDCGFSVFYVGAPGRKVSQIRSEQLMRESVEIMVDAVPPKDSPRNGRHKIVSHVQTEFPDLMGAFKRPWLVLHGQRVFNAWPLYVVALAVLFVLVAGLMSKALGASQFVAVMIGLVALFLFALGSFGLFKFLYVKFLAEEMKEVPSPDNAAQRPRVVNIIEGEDRGISNHFASLTIIKPNFLRRFLVRAVLFFIDLAALFFENKGTLSGIPAIHFARWVVLKKDRLLFLTNYGGSWESYLNDFIEKGHDGLTAVWSNSIGFPPSDHLTQGGATHEQEFKNFARNSQPETLYWYQAYPELTTSNIENNTRIREGLVGDMSDEEATQWLSRF